MILKIKIKSPKRGDLENQDQDRDLKIKIKIRELLSLLEKSRKTFLQLTCKKNFVKYIENLPQRLSEKFNGDNSSITDIALRS